MSKVSIIIPSRNEQFLSKTILDLLAKARGEIEVIAILDGWWIEPVQDPENRVHYIHWTESRGMRAGINAGVAIAKGKYVMKLDAHCMVAEGFDVVLAEVCQDNWVCVPTRQRLDPENWVIDNGGRPPINYLYMDRSNDGVNFKEWREKNKDRSLDEIKIDDLISCQGSCYFLPRDYFYELELLDEEHYGSFRKDPQEVTFKAWCSGGRCVRVKDTWYAHLHKGNRYGRGYSTNRADWVKGDEYVKRWFTDSAWDKQTKPFAWLMQKFSDMPGWEDYDPGEIEMIQPVVTVQPVAAAESESKPVESKPVETKPTVESKPVEPKPNLPNLYQILEIDGKPFSRPKSDRKNSRFWNEGKWESFIAPHLPEDCTDQTFVEMGTNAGLFLKLAADRGYRHVIGVEKDRTPVKMGLKYRDELGYDYEILKRTLGGKYGENGSFDIDELPLADVTLMSTFHYYIDINCWLKYLDRLVAKSCYALLVSCPGRKPEHWRASGDYEAVAGYFKNWQEIGKIENVSTEGDSKPRNLYSVLFKSPLIRRVPIDEVIRGGGATHEMGLAQVDLAEQVASGQEFDLWSTDYYQAWKNRKGGDWSERAIRTFVQMKADMMIDLKTTGLKDPVVVRREEDKLKLSDGGHRLALLRAMGHSSVIIRET